MKSLMPQKADAPQQVSPAREMEDSQIVVSKPTLLGDVPAEFKQHFVGVRPEQGWPEFTKLPPARGRCPITGASRSWILDQEKNGNVKIVRIRQRGRIRGACFVYVPSLLGLLRRELEKQTSEKSVIE